MSAPPRRGAPTAPQFQVQPVDAPGNCAPQPAGHLSPSRAALARHLARFGIGALALSTVLMMILNVLPHRHPLDPITSTLSEYALTPLGWMFDSSVIVLALGSAAVIWSLLLRGLIRPVSPATVMMAIWCVGLVGLIVFHKQRFGIDHSVESRLHWTWTLIAFVSLPMGAVLAAWQHRRPAACAPLPGWTVRLSAVSAAWFVALAAQTFVAAVDPLQWPPISGLIERALSATEMVTVLLLALWALRGCRCDVHPAVRRSTAAG